MSYSYNGHSPADAEEAHVRAKFAYFRKAEARIDLGPAKVEYRPVPVRKRVAECGTNYGYQRHIKNRTEPCRACLDARAVYQREYRARKKVAA